MLNIERSPSNPPESKTFLPPRGSITIVSVTVTVSLIVLIIIASSKLGQSAVMQQLVVA
jgi:hypothetical protein